MKHKRLLITVGLIMLGLFLLPPCFYDLVKEKVGSPFLGAFTEPMTGPACGFNIMDNYNVFGANFDGTGDWVVSNPNCGGDGGGTQVYVSGFDLPFNNASCGGVAVAPCSTDQFGDGIILRSTYDLSLLSNFVVDVGFSVSSSCNDDVNIPCDNRYVVGLVDGDGNKYPLKSGQNNVVREFSSSGGLLISFGSMSACYDGNMISTGRIIPSNGLFFYVETLSDGSGGTVVQNSCELTKMEFVITSFAVSTGTFTSTLPPMDVEEPMVPNFCDAVPTLICPDGSVAPSAVLTSPVWDPVCVWEASGCPTVVSTVGGGGAGVDSGRGGLEAGNPVFVEPSVPICGGNDYLFGLIILLFGIGYGVVKRKVLFKR